MAQALYPLQVPSFEVRTLSQPQEREYVPEEYELMCKTGHGVWADGEVIAPQCRF